MSHSYGIHKISRIAENNFEAKTTLKLSWLGLFVRIT